MRMTIMVKIRPGLSLIGVLGSARVVSPVAICILISDHDHDYRGEYHNDDDVDKDYNQQHDLDFNLYHHRIK